MSQARGVTAAFTGSSSFPLSVVAQGSGTVTSDSGGVSCTSSGGAGCQKPYASGTSVTLTAAPAVGWDFSGWSGACSNTSGTCTVTMSQARDVTALFEPSPVATRSLTVTDLPLTPYVNDADPGGETLPPVGGTITSAAVAGGGVNLDCGFSCLGDYLNDATVTVTATPAANYKLVSWGGVCSTATITATPTAAQTCTVPMTQNQNVSANFVLTSSTASYNLTAATTLSGATSTVAGQVTSNTGGVDCGATTTNCTKSFLAGTQVTLSATAAAGKKFNGWKDLAGVSFTGCQNEVDPATSTTCGVLVNAAKTVKADFLVIPSFYLQSNIGGSGSGGVRTSSGTDINCATGLAGTSADCSETYGSSTAVTLTATPDTGSTFDGFTASNCPAGTVGGAGTTCAVTVSQARTVDANFTLIELRKLSVQKGGTGTGALTANVSGSPDPDIACDTSCAAVKEKNYNKNTTVALVATPASGSRFRGWKELDGTATSACSEDSSTSATCTVALSVSRSLVANLGAVKALSGSKTGSGDGTLTTATTNWDGQRVNCPVGTASCAADYDQGDTVTLTASPESGSRFAGWSGACSASSGDCTVTMDAARSVVAQFVSVKQLTVNKDGNGRGAVVGAAGGINDTDLGCGLTCSAQKQKTFDKDTVIALTATPGSSGTDLSRFAGWKTVAGASFDGCALGENPDTSATCTVTLSAARSVVAKFIATRTLSVDKTGSGKGTVAGAVDSSADAALDCAISCTEQKQKNYDLDTLVALTATPGSSGADQSRFEGWKSSDGSAFTDCSQGSSGTGSICTVTLSVARSLVAKFIATRTLSVDKYGGATSDGKGSVSATIGLTGDADLDCAVSCTVQKQKSFDINTTVKLTAAPGTSDADLSEFQGWTSSAGGAAYSGCSEGRSGAGADCTVTLSEARTLVAQFKAIRRLNVSKSGSGAGGISGKVGGSADADADLSCGVACVASREKTFDRGTGVEVQASPDTGSTFAGWKNADGSTFTGCSEGVSGMSATCTVTLSEARVLRARFNSAVIVTKNLEVDKAGNGGGEVVGRVDGSADTDLTCASNCTVKKTKDLDESSTVVLTASPVTSGDNRSRFAGWKQADGTTAASECGPDPSTSAECTLSMAASRSVIARFILVKKLTVDKMVNGSLSGAAGLVSSDVGAISCNYTGTPCTSADQDFDFPGAGTAVTLSAESADDDRYRFDRWAGCGSNPTASQCTVTMDQARDVTAQFVELRRLSVAKTLNGSGSGSDAGRGGSVVSDGSSPAIDCTAGANCQSAFSRFDFSGGDGTGVTLAASVPEPDSFRFDGWAGACSGSASTCSVSMDQVRSVTAKFVKVRKLTVTKQVNGTTNGGGGVITADTGGNDQPGRIDCGFAGTPCASSSDRFDFMTSGTQVTLSAQAADLELYRFDGWTGCASNPTASQCEVTMDQAREVTANFVPIRRLTVRKRVNDALSGAGGTVSSNVGGISCDSSGGTPCSSESKLYDLGDTATPVTLSATPAGSEEYRFDGWKDDAGATFPDCSGTGDCTVRMSQARSVNARFVPLRKLTVTKKVRSSVDGSGGTVSSNVGSIDCGYAGTPCTGTSHLFDLGNSPTEVTLSATPADEDRFRFDGWEGCDATPSATTCRVAMDRVQSVTASFFPVRKLTVRKKVRDALDGRGGTVRSNIGGIDCDSSGSGCESSSRRYDLGATPTDVTLTATVSDDDLYRFAGWKTTEGESFPDCSGTDACTVSMSDARAIDASYIPVRRLTVDKTGRGVGAVAGKVGGTPVDEIDCGNSCADPRWNRFDQDTEVSLTATPNASVGSDRSRFAGWKTTVGASYAGCEEGSSGRSLDCTVAMSEARSLVADFKKIKPLTGSINGEGSIVAGAANWEEERVRCGTGVSSPSCRVEYDLDSEVTLTAAAKSSGPDRTRFRGWSGACTNLTGSCTVTLNDTRDVAANFSIIQPLTVEIERVGGGAGAVTTAQRNWDNEKVDCGDGVGSPDCEVDYDDGEVVTLTANPEPESTFEGWTDVSTSGASKTVVARSSALAAPAGCDTTGPCTVTLSQARYVRATFSRTSQAPSPVDPEPEPPAQPGPPAQPAAGSSTTLSLKVAVNRSRLRGRKSAVQTLTVTNTGPRTAEGTRLWSWVCRRMVVVKSQGAVLSRNTATAAGPTSTAKLAWRLGRLAPSASTNVKFRVAAIRGARSGPTKCLAATFASNAPRVNRSVRFFLFPSARKRPFQPTG